MQQTSKLAEQQERKGTITVITLRSAIIEAAVIQMFDNTPPTENFPNLYPRGAFIQENTDTFCPLVYLNLIFGQLIFLVACPKLFLVAPGQ